MHIALEVRIFGQLCVQQAAEAEIILVGRRFSGWRSCCHSLRQPAGALFSLYAEAPAAAFDAALCSPARPWPGEPGGSPRTVGVSAGAGLIGQGGPGCVLGDRGGRVGPGAGRAFPGRCRRGERVRKFALLRAVPRTAAVTARTGATMCKLVRDLPGDGTRPRRHPAAGGASPTPGWPPTPRGVMTPGPQA